MFPIYEQGTGKGIGLDLNAFIQRFDQICRDHLERGRARGFAFIFYDPYDRDIRKILKDQGGFAKLDRLAGRDLTVFYLHAGRQNIVKKFNAEFLSRLGVTEEAQPPCVIFFKIADANFTDIVVVPLDTPNLMHGFAELYVAVEEYIKSGIDAGKKEGHALRWIKGSFEFVSLEVVRTAIRKVLELLL